jgi:O-antigen ligase
MLMVSKRGLSRTYFFLVLAVTMPAEVVVLSRSSWVAAAIGVVLLLSFMLLHPGLRWRSLVTSAVASVIGIAVLVAMFGPITQRLLNSKDDATVAREIYKADARRMIDAAPWLGLGLNSYIFQLPSYSSMRMSSYGDQPPAVHNIFYMWWAETGLVGLLLFCAVWGSIIWTGLTNLSVRNELLFVANAACLAGMIALIPDSFLSFTLRVNTMLRVFWLLAGIIMAIRYQRLGERAARSSPVPVQAEVVVESPLP